MTMQIETSLGPVAVAVRGAGPALVLLHANPGDHRDYDAVLPALARRHTTYAVDWPGYGDSPPATARLAVRTGSVGATAGPGSAAPPATGREVSAMGFAAIVPEILDGLGLRRAAVIGNSVGGYAAAGLALARPAAVTALVLVNSGGFSRLGGPLTRGVIRLMGTEPAVRAASGRMPRFYLRRRTGTVREMISRDAARRHDPRTIAVEAALWRSFASPDHDLRVRAGAITAPTLLVWGTRDPMVGMDVRRVRRALPQGIWCPLPTGHAPFAEAPARFLDAVLPFLQDAAHRAD
ncbi:MULTISPECIES: alpha/beta fold hydrolase [Thermomonosporaceae]|uniref:alpha/beta fold hydrolase n=1 Tax=Thermomonosporaceae TaxID=2012 RepID=UPI00255B1D59|nr:MULTISPECIES: alpha/beta fold hydrolase [Thermomonosporaceae]MDL4777491.1 alpha/beta fold hydrolase [Actinomadura xylanilytica]